ncbi:MAG: uracil-DNA glycosylase [Campylobacterales bacterium]|nr:uracil-DNA glycosylase [Campylobacterales bacterium]
MLLSNQWQYFLSDELSNVNFLQLKQFLESEYNTKNIFPPKDTIFRAFNLMQPKDVKVVIIGQDPYHGLGQANGLAFSVFGNVKIPPSLLNIFKELQNDLDCPFPLNGDLTKWGQQGVLLINSVLTVEESHPNSHKGKGWEIFTDALIRKLSSEYEHLVFILWGAPSQKKELFIDTKKHLVLKSAHPSPLSAYRGFFGSKPFSQTNFYLKKYGKDEIEWCLSGQGTLL